MGEYTGRRRGRPAEEPQPGYEYEAPSYEAYGYSEQQATGEYYYAEGYAEEYVEQQPQVEEPYQEQYYQEQPYQEQYYAEQPYQDQPYLDYAEQPYQDGLYQEEPYQDGLYREEPYQQEPYQDSYAEPRFEPRRRSSTEASYQPQESYDYVPEVPRPHRQALPLLAHLPFLGVSTAALVIASFVSVKAVAAVVLPLQLLVAWAILDLAGHASRRTAVLVALPTLAATLGTFKFQADESATAVAGGLGVGFSLLAADAVFRAGRRGVAPGTVRALGAGASALLFAGLTGMFLPAARLDTGSVALGAAAGALAGLVAARNPELGSSRVVVVALPATAAALASYAAAILVT